MVTQTTSVFALDGHLLSRTERQITRQRMVELIFQAGCLSYDEDVELKGFTITRKMDTKIVENTFRFEA